MADSDLLERSSQWEQLLRKAGKAVQGVFGSCGAVFASRDLPPTETTLDEIRDELEAVLDEIILLQGHFGETITITELKTAIGELK